MKLTVKDIIIENEKDKITYEYLLKIRGEDGINYILMKYFNGATKPYISNIVKYAKIEIPTEIFENRKVLSKEEMQTALNEFKKKLKM